MKKTTKTAALLLTLALAAAVTGCKAPAGDADQAGFYMQDKVNAFSGVADASET